MMVGPVIVRPLIMVHLLACCTGKKVLEKEDNSIVSVTCCLHNDVSRNFRLQGSGEVCEVHNHV